MQWNLNLIKKIKNERERVFYKFFFPTWFWVIFTNYYALALPRDFQDFESFSKTRNISSSFYTSMKVENLVLWHNPQVYFCLPLGYKQFGRPCAQSCESSYIYYLTFLVLFLLLLHCSHHCHHQLLLPSANSMTAPKTLPSLNILTTPPSCKSLLLVACPPSPLIEAF